MKAASTALINYLNAIRAASDATMLMADCFTITLLNSTVLRYTNFDQPVAYGGNTFLANSILIDGLQSKSTNDLSVDQQKVTISALSTETVAGAPFLVGIQNGMLDGAIIQRERAFLDLSPVASVIMFKGRVGTVDGVGRTTANITVNSDLTLLDLQMPRNLYSPSCVHVLYDSGCGLNRASFSASGTVGAGPTLSVIPWSGVSQVYAQGKIVFTSGVNAEISANIKSVSGTALILSYPLIEAPSAGDTFTVSQGCDHTQSTCTSKFNNLANFRGFPYVPPPTFVI